MSDIIAKADLPALQKMRTALEKGRGVLTAGVIHPNIPTIHEVGNRPGQRIRVPEEPRHLGYGLFKAGGWRFDAGGAMQRSAGFSWTQFVHVDGEDVKTTGYDVDFALSAVNTLISKLEKE